MGGGLRIDCANSRVLNPDISLDDLAELRFGEVNHVRNDQLILQHIKHKRLGTLVTVVFYKERHLRQLTRELRTYSATFLILLVTGALMNGDEFMGKRFNEIANAVLSHHVIPSLEAIMLIYLLIRLFVESQSISSLLEGE